MNTTRKLLVMLATTFAAGLLFTNIYTSIVDAQNWGYNIPASIQATRDYFHVANPGTFFRLFSPLAQIITLAALVFCWTADKRVRYFLLAALILAVSVDGFTFAYFYPRNDIMFVNPIEGNTDAIRTAWSQWTFMNWPRSAIIVIVLILDFAALNRLISVSNK